MHPRGIAPGRVPYKVAAPYALIATSNFFELAVAVAIGLSGLDSGAALVTAVGMLVEAPVMLSLVTFSNRTQPCFLEEDSPVRLRAAVARAEGPKP